MPHDMMNTLHETGMPGSFHWLFWVVVIVAFALLLFLVWRLNNIQSKREHGSKDNQSLDTIAQNDRDKRK